MDEQQEKQEMSEGVIEESEERPEAEGEKRVEISESELAGLRKKAEETQKLKERLLQLQADLDNFRKRVAREREQVVDRANEHLLKELLSVLDHFEIGLQTAYASDSREAVLEGMKLIHAQIQAFLTKLGVEPIDAIGQDFDPALHEAVAREVSDQPAGKVIGQVRRGYRLKGHLLRTASVIVSQGKPE